MPTSPTRVATQIARIRTALRRARDDLELVAVSHGPAWTVARSGRRGRDLGSVSRTAGCRRRTVVRSVLGLTGFVAAAATMPSCATDVARAATPPTLVRPVDGAVARPYSFAPEHAYASGMHRGADLRAPAGAVVRAPCAGRILHTGRVPALGVVTTLACGGYRVTLGPLARPSGAPDARVRLGRPIGRVARGHGGALHLGVRRAGVEHGYVDPLALLVREPSPGPPPASRPRHWEPPPAVAPARPRAVPATSRPAPAAVPWPAWVGVALALAGISGSGTVLRRRRRRRAAIPTRAVTPGSGAVL